MTGFEVGQWVEYRVDGSVEKGVVTSTSERYVRVRFQGDLHSKACDPQDLVRVRS